jgi:hypothetical protein
MGEEHIRPAGHDGSTTQRLERLENKVDRIDDRLSSIASRVEARRVEDQRIPDRVRKLEDEMLVWDTRWSTINAMLSRIFGVSVIAAVASIVAIAAAIANLVEMANTHP